MKEVTAVTSLASSSHDSILIWRLGEGNLHFVVIWLFDHFLHHSSQFLVIHETVIFVWHLLLIHIDTQLPNESSLDEPELVYSLIALHERKHRSNDPCKERHLVVFRVQSKHQISTLSKQFQDLWLNDVVENFFYLLWVDCHVNLENVLRSHIIIIEGILLYLETLNIFGKHNRQTLFHLRRSPLDYHLLSRPNRASFLDDSLSLKRRMIECRFWWNWHLLFRRTLFIHY